MAFNKDKAFDPGENGVIFNDSVHVIGGSDFPSALNPTTPTLYLQTNGVIWSNPGNANWFKVGIVNFSFHKIEQALTISDNQQMIVEGWFEVTELGALEIEDQAQFQIKEQ